MRYAVAPFTIVRVVLGAVLLTAAAMKAHTLLRAESVDYATSPWLTFGIIEGELIFGLWLLSGLHQQIARVAAICLFSGLAMAALRKVVQGVPSCGCFGQADIHPAWMVAFDLLAIIALAWAHPTPRGSLSAEGR